MQKQFTPTPFAPIDRYILWFIILAAPLLFAGCECLLALGPGCSTTPFWQPSSGGSSLYCTYDHELREAQETEVGWVGVFETTKHCKKSRLSRTNYSTHYEGWTIAGFYDDEPASITGSSRDLFKNTDDKMCGSCEVRRHDKKRIKDLKIRVFEPYWMEVSAIVDGHAKLWNYYISRAEEVKVTDAFCPDILLYEHSRITECTDEKPNARSWWVPEEKLGDESIFFQDYINWAADRLNSPEMMLGLAMLALKWKSAPGDRSVEMTTEVSEILLEKLDCSKVFLRDRWYTEISPYSSLSRIWKHYLSSVEGLLSPPLQEQALKRCVDSIDAEVLRRIEEGRQFDVKAWSDRLEQEPLPSHEIVAVVDLYIIAGVPSSSGYYLWDHILSNYIQRRLTQHPQFHPRSNH